jgi:hypothetical protein
MGSSPWTQSSRWERPSSKTGNGLVSGRTGEAERPVYTVYVELGAERGEAGEGGVDVGVDAVGIGVGRGLVAQPELDEGHPYH